ncbi:uncharacterized protein LOC113311259 [Papaver somniferum]|uniref:uncharacterized protein LOC113311259 n=1 Tax=Papaver somniferum TaxID=3469 RepID=UPI000E7048E6|nr:uncharacterized protein LOC113311259 [Papaver somniferum]
MGLEDIRLTSDSQLVIRQLDGRYKINDLMLQRYSQLPKQYIDRIPSVIWRHTGWIKNRNADALAFITSMMVNPETRFIRIDSLRQPSIDIRGCAAEVINSGKSTPLYPQSNGQEEATNKTLADILKKKHDGHHKGWCEQLHNTLWAYNTTRREATGMSPFCLTYGVEDVLPTEVIIPTTKREAWENNLNTYLILKKLDDAEENREIALQHMINYHGRLSREYNKKFKPRHFKVGDLVLREIPPYQRESGGKLAKNWEGPYIVKSIVGNGAYEITGKDGEHTLTHPWNNTYLKKYYP